MRNARLLAALFVTASAALACSAKDSRYDPQATPAERERFAVNAALDAGSGGALAVGSRNDVLFEEGFSLVSYDPPDDYKNHAFRWMGQRGHVRLRAHSEHAMKLKLVGWVNEKAIRAKPVLTLYIDGQRIHTTDPVENGHWWIETVVPADMLRSSSWHDLLITLSAVAFHWSDPPTLTLAVLNTLEWTEVP